MQGRKEENWKRIVVQSSAGVAASFTQHLLHPFDLIKVRFQSHDSGKNEHNVVRGYRGLVDSLKTIHKEEGFRGFYKGMILSMIASNISYGIFFALYEKMRQIAGKHVKGEVSLNLVASSGAAALSSLVMQPMFVLKTRRLLDQKEGKARHRLVDLSREVYSHHGFRGFYRGYVLSLMLGLYGVMQITTYKYIKGRLDLIYGENKAPNWLIMVIGAVSRLCTSVVLHPLTTVRTRFQQNQFPQPGQVQKYTSIPDIFIKTYQGEGIRGFFKGIVPMTLRTLPSHGLFFLAYENTKNYMTARLGIGNIK